MNRTSWLLAVIAFLGLSSGSGQAATPDEQTYKLLVFSNPVAGREAEYNAWYDTQHAPDVVSVPGFVSAQRYVLSDQQLRSDTPAPDKYLVIFTIQTKDISATYDEVRRRNQTHEIAQSSSFDFKTARNYTLRPITAIVDGAKGDPATAGSGKIEHYLQLVFSDAEPGRDAEFNHWYAQKHAPSVASHPGFQSWQRFELGDTQLSPGPTEGHYLTVFSIASRDIASVFAGFRKEMSSGGPMPMTTSGHIGAGYTYRAIGPLLIGDDIRRSRRAGQHSQTG